MKKIEDECPKCGGMDFIKIAEDDERKYYSCACNCEWSIPKVQESRNMQQLFERQDIL